MIDKLDIMKLNELPIEQVAQALGLSVNRHKALCPFHNDSNPSLTFHRGKNRYRCFVCDAHGGTIDLVMRYLNKDFLSACKWLSEEHSIPVAPAAEPVEARPKRSFDPSRYLPFFERPFLSQEAQKFLFDERRLNPRVVQWCRLTSWRDKKGTPWLQIPYYSREGQLIGVQNRNLSYSKLPQPSTLNPKPSAPRFRFPTGAKCSIYNLPVLNMLKPGETLFITEGCSDCWAMLSSGHKAIAIPSATLLSRKDKELLQSLNQNSLNSQPSSLNLRFAMYPDQDIPGERLCLQLQQVLPSLVRYSLPAGCKDYSDYYLQSFIPASEPESPSTLIPQP